MGWLAVYGTGVTLHGFRADDDGRVQFTSWVSLFFIPLVPLGSWSGVYLGEQLSPHGGTLRFGDLRRVPHDGRRLARTFALGLVAGAAAFAPLALALVSASGRAARPGDMVLVIASACWPVALYWMIERRRSRMLEEAAECWLDLQRDETGDGDAGCPIELSSPPSGRLERELSSRELGVLALSGGAVLSWLGIVEPLRDAAHHAASVRASTLAAIVGPFLLGAGFLHAWLGEETATILGTRGRPTAFGRWTYLALLAAAVGAWLWLRSHLGALGYGA